MVSNATGMEVGLLAGRHPGAIGHLFSPGGQRGPWAECPHALDNGKWSAFLNGEPYDELAHDKMLAWGAQKAALEGLPPLWALAEDEVGNRDATLRMWERGSRKIRSFGFRCAFAVQNGMEFGDVPDDDCVLFLGGSSEWKDAAIGPWCRRFPGRVHVGRVNGMPRLLAAWRAGAISVDGTGWFHKGTNQSNDLRKFLRETHALPAVA